MNKMLREEVKRSIGGKGMFLALLIGFVIAGAHVIQYQLPARQIDLAADIEQNSITSLLVVADTWLAGNSVNLESFLYFLVVPILATLPFGVSYFGDMQSGFLKNIYLRTSRKQYLSAKYVATFLSGGIAVVLPLLLNLLCALVLLPNLRPEIVWPHSSIDGTRMLFELFYSYPMVYTAIYLAIDFILGGIFACVALSCSFLTDYKVIVAICPFFLQLVIHVLCTVSFRVGWSSVYFAQAGYGMKTPIVFFVYVVVGIGITSVVFLKKGSREDIF